MKIDRSFVDAKIVELEGRPALTAHAKAQLAVLRTGRVDVATSGSIAYDHTVAGRRTHLAKTLATLPEASAAAVRAALGKL